MITAANVTPTETATMTEIGSLVTVTTITVDEIDQGRPITATGALDIIGVRARPHAQEILQINRNIDLGLDPLIGNAMTVTTTGAARVHPDALTMNVADRAPLTERVLMSGPFVPILHQKR
jgi:hypothetical protein